MATRIGWTDETWNVVVGCSRVSPGCLNCYAFALHDKRHQAYHDGKPMPKQYALPFTVIQCLPERLGIPSRWRKPKKVFVNSVSDLFHEDVPTDFIRQVCEVMRRVDRHTYQVLTKRPERMRELLAGDLAEFAALPNAWWGVSVENRRHGLPRVEVLRQTPAAVRWLSVEPLLEDLGLLDLGGIDWVVIGAESGPRRRPMGLSWLLQVVEQCRTQRVACWVKQDSALLDGQQGHIPRHIWVIKEFPKVRSGFTGQG